MGGAMKDLFQKTNLREKAAGSFPKAPSCAGCTDSEPCQPMKTREKARPPRESNFLGRRRRHSQRRLLRKVKTKRLAGKEAITARGSASFASTFFPSSNRGLFSRRTSAKAKVWKRRFEKRFCSPLQDAVRGQGSALRSS